MSGRRNKQLRKMNCEQLQEFCANHIEGFMSHDSTTGSPWPVEVWPMTNKRCATSGFLMREGWRLCLLHIAKGILNSDDYERKVRDPFRQTTGTGD